MKHLLDPSQSAFCEAADRNIRLLAPAGCGKTLCLLFRCKHLFERSKRSRPRFLIVTFTRAARDELLTRLNDDSRLSSLHDSVEINTLNSWGFRRVKTASFNPKLISTKTEYHFAMLNQLQPIWRRKHEHIRNAIMAKKNQAPRVLMDIIDAFKSLGFDHVRHTDYRSFVRHWNALDQCQLKWRLEKQCHELAKFGVLEEPVLDVRDVYNAFFEFWRDAAGRLLDDETFTLEDQKYFAYLDEQQKIDQASFLAGAARYSHVLVDEFQDINPLDLMLVRAIVRRNQATVTIAGDDDQAIFEWRGATPEYILDPARFFDLEFEIHTLETNYRSPRNIVEHSQQLISHNTRRVKKRTIAYSSKMARIVIQKTGSLTESLLYVHEVLSKSVLQHKSPARAAIVSRKRSQIIPYQVYFASRGISFCAAEDLQIFLSDAFNRLLELITIKMEPDRRIVDGMLQLCDLVRKYRLKKTDREGLRKHLQSSRPISISDAVDALSDYRGPLKGSNSDGNTSVSMAQSIRLFLDATSISETLMMLSQHFEGLRIDLGKAEDDVFYTDPPFLQLAEYAASYGNDHSRFVADIERAKDLLIYTPPFSEVSQEHPHPDDLWRRPVHLMTALRAKGKEFDTVIMLDVIDGIWPSKQAKTPEQREAERRVFYVAFTRAREQIIILFGDRVGNDRAVISPYIGELGLSA